jgi:hypothetical protein
VYVRTLAPGLVAVIDAPLFQFVGRVLGVGHNPGYPLYVLLTYPFSYLPIGSLSYRINLFSALFGALTVSLVFLLARRLGCRRIVSAAAALGMAFGHIFWSQAVIAEVYTLDCAIIAGMLLALLAWGQTGRPGFFFASVALIAAGVGNHTTIVGFAPGMVLYALLTNRPFALRARTLALTTGILLAGLLQYGFIIVRSRQAGAYVEEDSRARTVGELIGVMTGAQFGDRLFTFGWRTVFFDRLPWLIGEILAPELTVPGLVLAVAGIAWLLRRRPAEGILILAGCAASVGFAVNYSVGDLPVFLIPATLVLWVAAAVGAEQAAWIAARRRWAAATVALATLMLPGWHLVQNFAATDRSRDTAAAIAFDGLFDALPDRSAFVHEDFIVDHMVLYKVLGDRSADGKRIDRVPRDAEAALERHDAGFSVFAFQRSARRLRYEGLNFSHGPVNLLNGGLEDLLVRLPDGAIVAFVVPAEHAVRFAASSGISFAAIGGPAVVGEGARSGFAIIGVRGTRRNALTKAGEPDLFVGVGAGQAIGETGVRVPADIEVQSSLAEATIRQGSRDLVRTRDGAAIAVWNPDGSLEHTLVMRAADDFRVPVPPSSLSVYPLRGIWPSEKVSSDDWTSIVDSTRTGSMMLRVPAGSTVVLYVSDDGRLAPRVIDRSADVRVEIASFHGVSGNGDRLALEARLDTDGVKGTDLTLSPHVYRIALATSSAGPVSALVALGGVPTRAVGRVIEGDVSQPGTIFRVDTMGLLRTPDRSTEVLLMTRDDQAQLTGDGWSAVDSDGVSAYRWMTRTEARLLLPIAYENARRIRMQALREEGGRATMVGLRVNGVELPEQLLRTGWDTYEWTLPAGHAGLLASDVVVTVDRLSAPAGKSPARGIAVTEFRVVHDP